MQMCSYTCQLQHLQQICPQQICITPHLHSLSGSPAASPQLILHLTRPLMKKLDLFEHLPDRTLAAIASLLEYVQLAEGDVLAQVR